MDIWVLADADGVPYTSMVRSSETLLELHRVRDQHEYELAMKRPGTVLPDEVRALVEMARKAGLDRAPAVPPEVSKAIARARSERRSARRRLGLWLLGGGF